jgi:hypothetical protein
MLASLYLGRLPSCFSDFCHFYNLHLFFHSRTKQIMRSDFNLNLSGASRLGHHFSSSSSNRRMQTGPSSLQGETEESDTRIAVLALRRVRAWRSFTGLP